MADEATSVRTSGLKTLKEIYSYRLYMVYLALAISYRNQSFKQSAFLGGLTLGSWGIGQVVISTFYYACACLYKSSCIIP